MYSAPSGYPRSSAAIETCAIQSCNRFTASSWRFVISALMSPTSFSAEYVNETVAKTSDAITGNAERVRSFILKTQALACAVQQRTLEQSAIMRETDTALPYCYFVLTDYIREAMRLAHYELMENG